MCGISVLHKTNRGESMMLVYGILNKVSAVVSKIWGAKRVGRKIN